MPEVFERFVGGHLGGPLLEFVDEDAGGLAGQAAGGLGGRVGRLVDVLVDAGGDLECVGELLVGEAGGEAGDVGALGGGGLVHALIIGHLTEFVKGG